MPLEKDSYYNNILLTGSSGFLGSIIFQFLRKSYNVFGLNRTNSFYNFDLASTIPDFNHNFFCVIHCAGLAHTTVKQENNIFHSVNVTGTTNLLKSIESSTRLPKQFVFISSVSVYGLTEGYNITERCELLANDQYGKSKIEAEKIVKKWCEEHNVICTILRLPLIVGENPPGNLGAMIHGIKKGYYFNISGGSAKKSMVLGADIARFVIQAANKGGIYNLTDGVHPSFYDLSNNISKQIGKTYIPNLPNKLAFILAKFGDLFGNKLPISSEKLLKITSTLTFDDTKARVAFGWNPSPVLDTFKIQ